MTLHRSFDNVGYNSTSDISGGPISKFVDTEVPEIEMITDSEGNPTRGGLIGYALAYSLLGAFLAYFFFFV